MCCVSTAVWRPWEPTWLPRPLLARRRGRQPQIDLHALAREDFILVRRPGAPGMYADIVAACRKAGFSPNVVREVPRMLSGLNLVSAGLGVTLVPASMQQHHLSGVVYCRVREPNALAAPLTLGFPTALHGGAAGRFVDFVKQRR